MGYENRDYARDDINRGFWGPAGGGTSFRDWPVWKKILAANVVVFLLQIFFVRPATLEDMPWLQDVEEYGAIEQFSAQMPPVSIVQDWLELDSRKVLRGQVWRVFTCGFCHNRVGIWHILMNMLFLYWFGSRLEQRYGSHEFAVFYFASLLVASLAYIGLDIYAQRLIPAIGASGAVWGVVALYALLHPYDRINLYFLVPIPIWLFALVYFLFDLHPVLRVLAGETVQTGVGHSAHVGGAIFGFLYYRNGWQLSPWVYKFAGKKKQFANSRSRGGPATIPMHGPYKQFDTPAEQRMDEILAKISASGRDSLTEEEEQFLLEQSKRKRSRS